MGALADAKTPSQELLQQVHVRRIKTNYSSTHFGISVPDVHNYSHKHNMKSDSVRV